MIRPFQPYLNRIHNALQRFRNRELAWAVLPIWSIIHLKLEIQRCSIFFSRQDNRSVFLDDTPLLINLPDTEIAVCINADIIKEFLFSQLSRFRLANLFPRTILLLMLENIGRICQ